MTGSTLALPDVAWKSSSSSRLHRPTPPSRLLQIRAAAASAPSPGGRARRRRLIFILDPARSLDPVTLHATPLCRWLKHVTPLRHRLNPSPDQRRRLNPPLDLRRSRLCFVVGATSSLSGTSSNLPVVPLLCFVADTTGSAVAQATSRPPIVAPLWLCCSILLASTVALLLLICYYCCSTAVDCST